MEKRMDEITLAAQENVNKVMFIFHGYGANRNDLYPTAKKFSEAMAEAEIHLANGIEKCDSGTGYQWFALEGDDTKIWEQAFIKNSSKIMSYINATILKKNLTYKDVILVGFSQGAMLSLSLGLKYGVKAIIAFSGLLFSPEICSDHKGTKVLLAHGAEDNVIPISAVNSAEKTLKEASISVRTAISKNLAHGINDYLLDQAVDFLKEL